MDVLRWNDNMCYPVIPEYPVDVWRGEFLGTINPITYVFRVLCYPNSLYVC